ncbi:hypothetical protein GCM10027280_07620 [Micromonospora polyrhachis]
MALAYSLGFAGLLLVGARLADVVGIARLLAWGIGAFTIASAIGGFATEGWTLIAARAVQGLSAAVVSPATFTLLTTTHAEGPTRTRAIAIWTAVSLAGGGLGNIASGTLTDLISWRATLLINLPIGAGIAMTAAALHRRLVAGQRGVRISLVGAGLATGAFACATYALSVAGGSAAEAAPALVGGVTGVLLFALLVVQQRHTAHPLVPSSLTRSRLILLGNTATALTAACFQIGLWYFLTYLMQEQLGYTPLQAGLAFLPLTASMLTVNLWVTPQLMKRLPSRALVVAGVAISAPGLIWLAVVDQGPFVLTILLPSIAIGIGGGLMNTPLATIVTTGVPSDHAGAASGLMNTAKQFGGAIGLAAATTAGAVAGTDKAAFAFMALALVMAAAITTGIPRSRDRSKSATAAESS